MMKKAHKLAKKMKGDYQARLSLALRQLWKVKKQGGDKMNGKELIAKLRGVEVDKVENNVTVRENYPAFFAQNPTTKEKERTARKIADQVSLERDQLGKVDEGVQVEFETKFAKENGIKRYRIRKHRDTEKYANEFLEYAVAEMKKVIN